MITAGIKNKKVPIGINIPIIRITNSIFLLNELLKEEVKSASPCTYFL